MLVHAETVPVARLQCFAEQVPPSTTSSNSMCGSYAAVIVVPQVFGIWMKQKPRRDDQIMAAQSQKINR